MRHTLVSLAAVFVAFGTTSACAPTSNNDDGYVDSDDVGDVALDGAIDDGDVALDTSTADVPAADSDADAADAEADAARNDAADTRDDAPTDAAPDAPAPDGDAALDGAESDAMPETDAAPVADVAPDGDVAVDVGVVCSPGTGTGVGEIARDVTLSDCDGTTHSLRDLCGAPATLIFSYAGWCPPCQQKAAEASSLFGRIEPAGAKMWFVVSATAEFGDPTADYCRTVRDRFGLTMTVLFDPTGAAQTALGIRDNDEAVVLDSALRIAFSDQYASLAEIEAAIESVLDR